MQKWYLITHNLHAFQLVTTKLRMLEVELFAPTKLKVTKRRDCSGVRTTETQLFPGYLFVRLDPEVVHTSAIQDIPGVKEFVRFGGDICTVSDSLIDSIKHSLLLRTDKKVTQLEYRNVSLDVASALEGIALIKDALGRQAAFFELLQKDQAIIKNSSNTRIVSVIEQPYVNETIR